MRNGCGRGDLDEGVSSPTHSACLQMDRPKVLGAMQENGLDRRW